MASRSTSFSCFSRSILDSCFEPNVVPSPGRCHCPRVMVVSFSTILPGSLALRKEMLSGTCSVPTCTLCVARGELYDRQRMATGQERQPLYYCPPQCFPYYIRSSRSCVEPVLLPLFSQHYGSVAVVCSTAKGGGPFPYALRRSRRPHRFYYVRLSLPTHAGELTFF